MVIANLNKKSIFIDTTPLIYFIEGHSLYQPILTLLFNGCDNGQYTFITSTITLLEVLVGPIRAGREDIVTQYQKLLTEANGIEILEISNNISIKAAHLRAKYNLKTPDALQLATAIVNEANYFLTNDLRLKNVASIEVITLSDFV
jgi:predicted nucleic acid-binding protein